MPSACQHATGAGADIEQVVGLGRSDNLIQRRLDLPLVDIKRTDVVPSRRILAKIGSRDLGALPLDRGQSLQIEADRPVSLAARHDQVPHQGACRAAGAQAIEHPTALAKAVEQSGIAQQLQMPRHARLALPEDLRQFADRQLAARAQNQEPQPGRFRGGAQCEQQFVHRCAGLDCRLEGAGWGADHG
jgi:hypothetical protein